MYFGHIRASDLLLVNHDGDVVEGKHPVNAAAFAIHSQVHAARPDVVAAAHAHSMYGKSWSSLGRLIDPLTQDACAFFEDHALFDDYTGVVLDTSEGRRIAKTLGEKKAIILRNHGLLTVGETIPEAFIRFWRLNRSCEIQLAAQAAKLRVPSPAVCEASYQMGEEFLSDQADVGQLEFDSIVRKLDDSYKN
jgi:ribulose-5-phosphate 4-epimerase/fuculose-1-phosphate aldolase